MNLKLRAFTLIELLIVVAIIAILAAIAVPNFLEAQTRAKVSRARADMRTLATGLETYHIDNNSYVYQNAQCRALRIVNTKPLVLELLTTPVAYLNSAASVDPFKTSKIYNDANLTVPNDPPSPNDPYQMWILNLYKYYARNLTNPAIADDPGAAFRAKPLWYILGSTGPDGISENLNPALTTRPNDSDAERAFYNEKTLYDATNGTVSRGSIYRVGGVPSGNGKAFYGVVQAAQ